MAKPRDLPVISLFSGAMGLDLGLEQAGLKIAVAVECNRYAVQTIQANRPGLPVIAKRIEEVSTKEILKAAGLKPGEAFAVVGGPSCQVFSTAGGRGSLDDPRGELFREFVRVVKEAKPRFFAMENVRGLLSAAVRHRPLAERGPGKPPLTPEEELGSAFQVVVEELRALGYATVFDLVNAADYGVPQTRQRLVFLGSREGRPLAMPAATHAEGGRDGLAPWTTVREALVGLTEPKPDFYHFCPSKRRFLALVPEGGNWRDLPIEMQREALGRASDSWGGRSGFFRRLSWNTPSPALTTRPDSKATSLCHPTEVRPLTVGEYCRIQQFPPGWRIEGPVRQKYAQVGNAVPIGIGAAIGTALRTATRRPPDWRRLGRVECANLDLLLKMAKRPRVVLNPPRMRGDDPTTVAEWIGGRERFRGAHTEDLAAPRIARALAAALAPKVRAASPKEDRPAKRARRTAQPRAKLPRRRPTRVLIAAE